MNDDDPFDDKATREYYDRKVARAEEILPYLVVLLVVALSSWVGYVVWQALAQLLR